jgi:hypothetical protein
VFGDNARREEAVPVVEFDRIVESSSHDPLDRVQSL